MKKQNHLHFSIVIIFFVLTVNINAYGTTKKEALELTPYKGKDTVSYARHLFEMMAIDTKIKNGKHIWYYNRELLHDKDKESLLNLEKLDKLAKLYKLPIDLDRNGISIDEDRYQNFRAHNTTLNVGLTALEEYLEGINEHRTPSCLCFATNTDYFFKIEKTSLCKALIIHKVISEDEIKKIGNKNKIEHIKLLNKFCFFISSMFVEKVQFKDITTAISNLANKTAEELFPEDKRTQNKIKEIKKNLNKEKPVQAKKVKNQNQRKRKNRLKKLHFLSVEMKNRKNSYK